MSHLPIKCSCNPKSEAGFCPTCSAYKMVCLLKNGCDDLKLTAPNGAKVNPVWYNFYSKNRKDVRSTFAGMLRRVQNDSVFQFIQVIQLYENKPGGQLLADLKM